MTECDCHQHSVDTIWKCHNLFDRITNTEIDDISGFAIFKFANILSTLVAVTLCAQ